MGRAHRCASHTKPVSDANFGGKHKDDYANYYFLLLMTEFQYIIELWLAHMAFYFVSSLNFQMISINPVIHKVSIALSITACTDTGTLE
jgi:hypothetical protein